MDWYKQAILKHYRPILKGLGLATSLIFALYLSLTAIVVIPVFNDTTDRLKDGEDRLKDQLPHLLELYNNSLISTAAAPEDKLPNTAELYDQVRQLWANGPSVPMGGGEPVQAKGPPTQATAAPPLNLVTLLRSELQAKISELDRQITDFGERKQNLERATENFQQNGKLVLQTVTEYFEQQNAGHHVGGDLTLRHSTLLVGQYGSWLAQYTTNIARCDGEKARAKNEIVIRDGQIRKALTSVASSPHPETDPVLSEALLTPPFRGSSPRCINIVPDFDETFFNQGKVQQILFCCSGELQAGYF